MNKSRVGRITWVGSDHIRIDGVQRGLFRLHSGMSNKYLSFVLK